MEKVCRQFIQKNRSQIEGYAIRIHLWLDAGNAIEIERQYLARTIRKPDQRRLRLSVDGGDSLCFKGTLAIEIPRQRA